MKIKIVLHEPYNGMTSGLPTRYIGMIRELYKRHRLSIFAPGNTDKLREIFPKADVCKSTSSEPERKRFSPAAFVSSFVFPKREKIFLPMCEFFPEYDRLLHENTVAYDAIYYFWLSAAIMYRQHSGNAHEVCDLCDSLLRHFLATLCGRGTVKTKLVNVLDIFYLWRIKRKFIDKSIKCIVTTEKDAECIRRTLPRNTVVAIPNGIYLSKSNYNEQYFINKWQSKSVLFCGSLNYNPNINTIRYILTKMWKPLQQKIPGVKLDIVGRDPGSDFVRFINSFQGVTIHSNVPDVFTFYKNAKIILAPLFLGGGIKNKILEALCTGTPIVTNIEGATGVAFKSSVHGLLGESTHELIDATVNVMRENQDVYVRYAKNCLGLAREYSWTEVGNKLEREILS